MPMPSHDIIDNRDQPLVDHINQILGSADAAKVAVGYFFVSGLDAIRERIESLTSIRLLIGNTSNRETLEQIAEGYQRIDLTASSLERENFSSRSIKKDRAEKTAENIRHTIERMDQTDDSEAVVRTLVRLIEEKRLDVRVYTRGRL